MQNWNQLTDELHGAIHSANRQRRTRWSIRRLNHILLRKLPEPHPRVQLLHRICLLHHYWNSTSHCIHEESTINNHKKFKSQSIVWAFQEFTDRSKQLIEVQFAEIWSSLVWSDLKPLVSDIFSHFLGKTSKKTKGKLYLVCEIGRTFTLKILKIQIRFGGKCICNIWYKFFC